MTITLGGQELEDTLDRAFLLATSDEDLSAVWIGRAERLGESPSVAFIAAVGAALLAKATDSRVDSFVIQAREGSAGAYSLRRAATALAQKRHAYGYDIGSSSDRDPINHGTLVSSKRWEVALERITPSHKHFFQVILGWLADINAMSEEEANEALAAFIRVRREVAPGAAAELVPLELATAPRLNDLIAALEAFSSADSEGGARGMALVAAAYRAAGFEADVPSRNDPRRIDIPIKVEAKLLIGSEVKQQPTHEATADTLAEDAAEVGANRALLVVLPPGALLRFDIPAVIRRAEHDHGVVLRILESVRAVLHEAIAASSVPLGDFCSSMPRAYADALRDIRAGDAAIETWAAVSGRWA
ncbi:MAG: restriction endonuclease, SacI family [Solirubrobacterales bacterium]